VCVFTYILIHIYLYIPHAVARGTFVRSNDAQLPPRDGPPTETTKDTRTNTESEVGLHTISPLPILYGVWHTQRGSVGVVYCASVLQ